MHIQRPIIVTEKQKMYGDVFHSTQAYPHSYECVQPLQGLITFTEPEEETYYRNNLYLANDESKRAAVTKKPEWQSWDSVIYVMLLGKLGIGVYMLLRIQHQTAYNDIYLTNFKYDQTTYSVVAAGTTNALYCLLIALSLVIFSVIIGLTSSKQYMLSYFYSGVLWFMLLVLQVVAMSLHILMLSRPDTEIQSHTLTTLSMLVLHVVTCILSVVGLIRFAVAPQSNQIDLQGRITTKNESIEADLKKSNEKQQQKQELFSRIKPNGTIEPRENEETVGINDMKNLIKSLSENPNEISSDQYKILTQKDIERETTGNFWLCVVEDLNTIVCYAFVVRVCDAQSSIHDDSTTFFDVLCIVFLGFLQHVANILMIFHAHIDKQTELKMKTITDKDTGPQIKKKMEEELDELMTFIARTRLLLFFMIGMTVVFFYLRVAPTYEEYAIGIPYEILRVLALITMVSLNTLHSFWYEIQNAQHSKKPWDTSPTWKLGALAFIALVFSSLLLYNTLQDQNEDIRKTLHAVQVHMTPAPSPTSTPVPSK